MDIHLSEGKRDKNSLENKGILTGGSNRKNSVITQLAPYSLEDCSFLGEPKQIIQEKKKPRRSKKQTEKELLQDYYNDNENHSFVNKKKICKTI